MIRRLKAPLLSALALLLAGCTLLPSNEPPSLHLLPATPLSASDAAPQEARLRIETPHAPAPLADSRILVMPEPNRLQAYAGARWSERAPLLLRDRLLDAFRDDGRLVVRSDSSALPADLTLASDLRAFYSEYLAGEPQAVVRLDASLMAGSRLLAERRFEVRHQSAGHGVADVVNAFGLATDALAAELVAWTLETLQAP